MAQSRDGRVSDEKEAGNRIGLALFRPDTNRKPFTGRQPRNPRQLRQTAK